VTTLLRIKTKPSKSFTITKWLRHFVILYNLVKRSYPAEVNSH
jgi:hypothetical protein